MAEAVMALAAKGDRIGDSRCLEAGETTTKRFTLGTMMATSLVLPDLCDPSRGLARRRVKDA
jgi:hypothetical protein